jgi:hypothetical protein
MKVALIERNLPSKIKDAVVALLSGQGYTIEHIDEVSKDTKGDDFIVVGHARDIQRMLKVVKPHDVPLMALRLRFNDGLHAPVGNHYPHGVFKSCSINRKTIINILSHYLTHKRESSTPERTTEDENHSV